ncbi:hypothetical protein NECAME_05527 [Necator americanus]|uniref:Neurotransmitter-gated ion-channel transmembrane domain-containing protein n=1 Tax=Necator americanus TaxID=51031 RepID=W2SIV3_NECAM|nr:hypothetical protein NECAME_05527 [Necator americanus]ETN68682.1 hypothetical protein NECAME_05527 [Necator americanus]
MLSFEALIGKQRLLIFEVPHLEKYLRTKTSMFSFWLDVEAVPARVSLAITTLLTLSTQANAARMALPEVSYMKAIDVWMGACMIIDPLTNEGVTKITVLKQIA